MPQKTEAFRFSSAPLVYIRMESWLKPMDESLFEAIVEEEFGIAQLTEEAYHESLRVPTKEEVQEIDESLPPSPPPSDRNGILYTQWLLKRHGKYAYAYVVDLDEVCANIRTKYADKVVFDLHRAKIRFFVLQGFPLDVQELINGKPQSNSKSHIRVNAMARLNRVVRNLRRHAYGDDDEDDEDIITKGVSALKVSKDDIPSVQSPTTEGKNYPFFLELILTKQF